jgi:hypothetical protein
MNTPESNGATLRHLAAYLCALYSIKDVAQEGSRHGVSGAQA